MLLGSGEKRGLLFSLRAASDHYSAVTSRSASPCSSPISSAESGSHRPFRRYNCCSQQRRCSSCSYSSGSATGDFRLDICKHRTRHECLSNACLKTCCLRHSNPTFGAGDIVTISRQRDRRQNTNNCHHNHQFDQGEALLCLFHDPAPLDEHGKPRLTVTRHPACQLFRFGHAGRCPGSASRVITTRYSRPASPLKVASGTICHGALSIADKFWRVAVKA